jgi:hypothetical protein
VTSSPEIDGDPILSFFETMTFKKKDILQEEDKRCLLYFFVVKGRVRLFFTDHNSAQQTLQLVLENPLSEASDFRCIMPVVFRLPDKNKKPDTDVSGFYTPKDTNFNHFLKDIELLSRLFA